MAFAEGTDLANSEIHASTLLSENRVYLKSTADDFDDQQQSDMLQRQIPNWHKELIKCRNKWDLENDLGGLAVAKTWGLSICGNYVAACFTVHPGDMIQYIQASEETCTVVFGCLYEADIPPLPFVLSAAKIAEISSKARSEVITMICKYSRKKLEEDLLGRKLLYAAACSTLFQTPIKMDLLQLGKEALAWLGKKDNVDLGSIQKTITDAQFALQNQHETSRSLRFEIPAQRERLSVGQRGLFEICEVCGETIGWHNAEEARCAAGHMFGNLPSLYTSLWKAKGLTSQ